MYRPYTPLYVGDCNFNRCFILLWKLVSKHKNRSQTECVDNIWACGVALGYGLDGRGLVVSRQGLQIALFTTASRPPLGPTQPPVQWIPGALSWGVKRPGREADHLPLSTAEVKNAWSYTSAPPICFHGVMLRENN
jgi:hypothetical protein